MQIICAQICIKSHGQWTKMYWVIIYYRIDNDLKKYVLKILILYTTNE